MASGRTLAMIAATQSPGRLEVTRLGRRMRKRTTRSVSCRTRGAMVAHCPVCRPASMCETASST
jgi:hypothetical protein